MSPQVTIEHLEKHSNLLTAIMWTSLNIALSYRMLLIALWTIFNVYYIPQNIKSSNWTTWIIYIVNLTVISYIIYSITYSLLKIMIEWYEHYLLYRVKLISLIRQTWILKRSSKLGKHFLRRFVVTAGPVYLVLVATLYFTNWSVVPFLILFSVLMNIAFVHNFLLPASVLFLSDSSEDSLKFQENIAYEIFPYHVSSFFLYKGKNRGIISTDLYRTDDEYWEGNIDKMMKLVPLIVMDVRKTSPPLEYEINMLKTNNQLFKLIILGGEKNLLLESIGDGIGNHSWANADNIPLFLRHLLIGIKDLPTEERDIHKLILEHQYRES